MLSYHFPSSIPLLLLLLSDLWFPTILILLHCYACFHDFMLLFWILMHFFLDFFCNDWCLWADFLLIWLAIRGSRVEADWLGTSQIRCWRKGLILRPVYAEYWFFFLCLFTVFYLVIAFWVLFFLGSSHLAQTSFQLCRTTLVLCFCLLDVKCFGFWKKKSNFANWGFSEPVLMEFYE